ncbi:MAG: RsiV family protein, partial [Lachnospiraceae bacterium]|nr:RsiV family protein [Lachnospiraceae bacterium]
MKKFTSLVALGLSASLIFSACGSNTSSDQPTDTTPTEDVSDTSSESDTTSEENESFIAIQPVITTHTYSKTTNDGATCLFSASTDTISLDEESAQYYPELNDGLVAYSDTLLNTFQTNAESNSEYAISDYASGFLEDGMYYEDESKIKVERADEQVFSISESNTAYLGGAHGSYGLSGVTFDTKTGKQIELTDVFTNMTELIHVIEDTLMKEYPNTQFFNLSETMLSYLNDSETYQLCWFMTSEGVEFVFNPYELASYADGMQTIMISFNDHPELFTGNYTASEDAFVTNLEASYDTATNYIDLDRDGISEVISIQENYDEDMYATATFTFNGSSYTIDEYYYDMDAKLVHTKDGKNYIYAFLKEENAYTSLNVMEVSEKGISFSGSMNGAEPSEYFDSDDSEGTTYTTYSFVSPNGFTLATRLDSLSTYDGIKNYTVGDDGMPTSNTDFYTIRNGLTLTAKTDFGGKEVNIETNELGSDTIITNGTKLTFYRTNGTDTVIFQREDGTYVGVTFELNSNYEP